MEERDQLHRQRERELEERDEPEALHRKTEQGDELTEIHSVAQREQRGKNPYRPPRQPSQERPAGDERRGRGAGS